MSDICKLKPLAIKIGNSADCRRYITRWSCEGPTFTKLGKRMSDSIGQRSINNIVDAANFVMFDMGQPLHAFDADKVKGAIQIRRAKGMKNYHVGWQRNRSWPDILIIADDEGPFAIAGIKGGKSRSNQRNKKFNFRIGQFSPNANQKPPENLISDRRLKRFENEISPVIAQTAMNELSALIAKVLPDQIWRISDKYPEPTKPRVIKISPDLVAQNLVLKFPKN